MTPFIALLRAVNVDGIGKLPMKDLVAMCEEAGFTNVKTYIASGNAVFASDKSETQVKAELERALLSYAGKPVGVLVRSAAEIADVLATNPFPEEAPNRTVAIFLDAPPPSDTVKALTGQKDEDVRLGVREIYIHYPGGQGQSKLKIPAAKTGTARNMNTVAKLAAMAAALQA